MSVGQYCPFWLGRTWVAPVLKGEPGSRIVDKIAFVECAIVIHGDFGIRLEVMWKSWYARVGVSGRINRQ
jgi:hypothetical protein